MLNTNSCKLMELRISNVNKSWFYITKNYPVFYRLLYKHSTGMHSRSHTTDDLPMKEDRKVKESQHMGLTTA